VNSTDLNHTQERLTLNKRRVVVTGIGMITPLGHNVDSTWQAIIAGKSGVARIDHFDASDLSCQICSRVKDFDPTVYMPEKEARKRDYFIQYGMAAATQAIQDSGLQVTEANAHRIGLAIGSGIGGLPSIEKHHSTLLESGPRRISPFFIPGALINMIAGNVSIQYGMKGPNIALVSACTTGTHNIGLAARSIVHGDADVMVAGASEMATTKLGISGFAAMRALSTRNNEPEKASRPWDKDRDGFVLGDGAGMYASINPEDINYINAHGTSTPAGDELEVLGIKRSFGEHAYKLAVSSTKSMTGHLLGAAGAVEAIFSILAIRDQVAPPTINLENPSEGCDLNFVPNIAQNMPINIALSNSFGFGGTNGTLIFRKM